MSINFCILGRIKLLDMKKVYKLKESFLGKKIMGNLGIINLIEKTSQKDLKKLYQAGFSDMITIEEVKEEKKPESNEG